MASAPSEPRAVLGRLDRDGRLISADAELETLQREAGSSLGEFLALPQIAAVAGIARKLRTAVARPAIAASIDHDIELWVRATPDGDDIALSLEGWTARPAARPRLAAILGGGEHSGEAARNEWAADEELRVISLSRDLAELLGVDGDRIAGQPLTRVLRLEEDEAGDMPLISALAARRSFAGQPARSRNDDSRLLMLSGEVVKSANGSFAGFRGVVEGDPASAGTPARTEAFDQALDEVLRSPLDRIIETAERIVARSDGPLRSDYATYGSDITTAARHLLSVLHSMSNAPAEISKPRSFDLAALAAEAIVLLDSQAVERSVSIQPEGVESLPAVGDESAAIQILVNLIGNAIRHSPQGGTIRLIFDRRADIASLSVCDQGPGVPAADRERIFERFEQADPTTGGTGLGLAISRRLARSMGGDVTLEADSGDGARFTLTLPAS